MVVAGRAGHTNANHDDSQKRRVCQRDAEPMEIISRMKRELVYTGFETVGRDQRGIGSTVGVGRDGRNQSSVSALHQMQLDRNALCRRAACDVENVRGDSRHSQTGLKAPVPPHHLISVEQGFSPVSSTSIRCSHMVDGHRCTCRVRRPARQSYPKSDSALRDALGRWPGFPQGVSYPFDR